jgi:hypothetical protein
MLSRREASHCTPGEKGTLIERCTEPYRLKDTRYDCSDPVTSDGAEFYFDGVELCRIGSPAAHR